MASSDPPPSQFEIDEDDDRVGSNNIVSHSLPVPEEVRTENAIAAQRHHQEDDSRAAFIKTRRRKNLLIVVGSVVGLALVLSLMISFLTKGERKSKASALQLDVGRDGDVDPATWASVIALLQTYTPANKLQTTGTPQNLAANWITRETSSGTGLDIPASREYDVAYEFVQRYVMATFYFALNGENWDNDLGFLSTDSVCDWNDDVEVTDPATFIAVSPEVRHGKIDANIGVHCNDDDEVSSIFIPNNGLKGRLPPETGLLEAMVHFSVYSNTITGSLPESLQYWNDLEVFIVEDNQMTGSLPAWIDQWEWLQTFSVAHNSFSGRLPSGSFDALTNLKSVALNHNQFMGDIDAFNKAENLEIAFLQNNQFTGIIDESFMGALPPLKYLDLSHNQIKGQLYSWMYAIQVLNVHDNQIGGALPPVDDDDYEVEFLSAYGNQLTDSIPDNIGDLVNLVHVDLSNNKFTGIIPASFNNILTLKQLYLGDNPTMDVQNFPRLAECWRIEEISLRNCNIDDGLPFWIGNQLQENLVLLDLTNNKLHGEIHPNLSWAAGLRFLLLGSNNFEGSIPDSLVDLEDLQMFIVDNNPNLEGSVGQVCDDNEGPQFLSHVVTDCSISCTCCDSCCSTGSHCAAAVTTSPNLDGFLERKSYVFSDTLIFDVEEGTNDGGAN